MVNWNKSKYLKFSQLISALLIILLLGYGLVFINTGYYLIQYVLMDESKFTETIVETEYETYVEYSSEFYEPIGGSSNIFFTRRELGDYWEAGKYSPKTVVIVGVSAYVLVSWIPVFIIIYAAFQFLKNIRDEDTPFISKNAKYIAIVGWCMLFIGLAADGLAYTIIQMSLGNLRFSLRFVDISWVMIAAGTMFLMVGNAFGYAAYLQQEHDETI